MEQLFEKATREKFTFPSSRGDLTVEELWDLPLTSKNNVDLDTVAKAINKQLKDSDEESFVTAASGKSKTLEAKLEVVKYIIKVKMDENEAKKTSADKLARKRILMEALEQKQQQEILGMSADQIKAEIEKL
jgi:hypothetical protein